MCFLFLKVKPFGRISLSAGRVKKKIFGSCHLIMCSPTRLKGVYGFTRKLLTISKLTKYMLKFQF